LICPLWISAKKGFSLKIEIQGFARIPTIYIAPQIQHILLTLRAQRNLYLYIYIYILYAQSASIVHVLVERPVESDSKASNDRNRWNDSIWHNDESDVINFVLSTDDCELYYFRFEWIELKTIHLKPEMNTSCAVLYQINFVWYVSSGHRDVDLSVISILVMTNTE